MLRTFVCRDKEKKNISKNRLSSLILELETLQPYRLFYIDYRNL